MGENISKEELNKLFGLFHLDIRSSQRELEIAYDVLTANKDVSQEYMSAYRKAFEYLMLNHFKSEGGNLTINKEDYYTEEEHCKNILKNLPQPVKEGLQAVQKEVNLSDKARALLAVQKVNLPMFFNAIKKDCSDFFGFKFWTKRQMSNILNECMMNTLVYQDVVFSFTCKFQYEKNELWSFLKNISKYYSSNEHLCKKFQIDKTNLGVTGMAILESDLISNLAETLEHKAEALDCSFSLRTGI